MAEKESTGVAEHGRDPVRWWMFEDAVRPINMLHVPLTRDDTAWEARYDNDAERGKRTTRYSNWLDFLAPGLFPTLRGQAAEWSTRLGYPVEDDPTLHGGGLHVTVPGGWLSTHLDYDLHPHLPGRRRALNLIAFLNPKWREEWGGALVLCDPMGKVVTRLYPRPGRLVAFEVGDLSYHGVEPLAPNAPERVTAAVYYLSAAGPTNTRRRALFLPNRGM